MAELLYTINIINSKNEILAELHSQRYSMGFLDFFFTENDKEINFVKKDWYYKVNCFNSIKNARFFLNKFKDRYNKNKNNNLYLDDKSENEIKKTFDFIEKKINTIEQTIKDNPDTELFLHIDLSEVLFMYDLEKDIPFGENRRKQEKYINDLIDGVFSEQLESKEMAMAKEKLKDLRTAFLRQARIIYIPEITEEPQLWFFNEHILVTTELVVQVYEKALLETPQHNEIIDFALKAIKPSYEARNAVIDFNKNESEELLKDGKILVKIKLLFEKP